MKKQGESTMHYKTQGVCASEITFDINEGRLYNVKFENGCPGNLQAIQLLVEGMLVDEIVAKLKGLRCGDKETSCVDQLVQALNQKN